MIATLKKKKKNSKLYYDGSDKFSKRRNRKTTKRVPHIKRNRVLFATFAVIITAPGIYFLFF